MTSKRKRSNGPARDAAPTRTVNGSSSRPLLPPIVLSVSKPKATAVNLQIITGSYEKVLHGFIASIPVASLSPLPRRTTTPSVADRPTELAIEQDVALTTTFSDSFLFTAHTAPLRCIALSPPSTSKSNSKSSKRILATGSPDERVNLYTLSSSISAPPPSTLSESKPTASNKHLGTLHEHTNTPSALLFTPNRNKLITAGEDSQILIFRTRDWSLLSTLKAPKPKASASTTGIGLLGNGERPSGFNDIALHPSQKILLSVSKGERALRMWNLMTGRKAGALGFTREVMGSTLGTKIGGSSGEGQKVRWSPDGEEFTVAFERGVVVFGMDSQPKLRILPSPIGRVHQIHYVTLPGNDACVLAISTEDGRIIFYSTTACKTKKPNSTQRSETNEDPDADESEKDGNDIDNPIVLGHVGGREMGMVGRVKDFVILEVEMPCDGGELAQKFDTKNRKKAFFLVSAGSDGTIRIWALDIERIKERLTAVGSSTEPPSKKAKTVESTQPAASTAGKTPQVGSLVGIYETGRRVTCLSGMVMEEGWSFDEGEDEDEEREDSDSSQDDSAGGTT